MYSHPLSRRVGWVVLGFLLFSGVHAGGDESKTDAPESPADVAGAGAAKGGSEAAQKPGAAGVVATDRATREGVVVDFVARSVSGQAELMEGDYAEITFRFTGAVDGLPLQSMYPAVWMDIGGKWGGQQPEGMSCKEKIGLFLKGIVGIRPMIDLNSYFVLVLNKDPSITVIDPIVGITGRTNLYATIILKRPGADWAKSRDEKRLFVTMPLAGQVAVVDTETFKVTGYVDAGSNPVRVALQADGRYLWVGNDARDMGKSGVTVIDVNALTVAARIPTGKGHHEIALSADDRHAFVSNRDEGTVSVIDVQQLKKVRDLKTGPLPISLAFSSLSQALYVADAKEGVISVVDGRRHEVTARIKAKPGLGPVRATPDGRWALAVNTSENAVHVVDASTNRLAQTIPVGAQPYQVAFSRAFAYVRSLGTEQVSMIKLSELGRGTTAGVTRFGAGATAPGQAGDVSIADAVASAAGEAAVLVVNPADGNVYYYMEGMVAPMGTYRNYGHTPGAVQIADRTLKETEPGVYATKVRIPAAGTYDVALLVNSPRIFHCFSVSAKPNPALKQDLAALDIEYLLRDRTVRVGDPVQFQFRLTDPESRQPQTGLKDVRVLYYMAPGILRREVKAREVGDGVYEVALSVPRSGAYYVYVASASAKVQYADLPFVTLRAVGGKTAPKGGTDEKKE